MSTRRTGSWILAILLTLSILLTGCTPPTPAAPPPTEAVASPVAAEPAATEAPQVTEAAAPEAATVGSGKVATISFTTGDPESLNPIYAYSWTVECAFDLFLLPMWNIDADGSYMMELAEELPSLENGGLSADGLTITYKLRPDVKWSDGEPVTAQDAVFTYEMTMADANTAYSRYPWDTYVAGVTAPDEHTVVLQLTQPYADWSTSFFTGLSRVIPEHILRPVYEADGTLDNAEWNRQPTVGNGPFLLVEYAPASHLIFTANPDYWRGRPKLDEVHFRLMEDRAAQLAAMASGESEVGSYIVGSELPEIEKMGGFEIQTANNGMQVVLFQNVNPETAHPAMTDPKVRQALAYATDRQLIIDELFNGVYEIPASYWHGSIYEKDNLDPRPFHPGRAIELLDEAGWVDANGDGVREKDGQDLALRYAYISGEETTDTMVVTLQQMWADVGIKVDLLPNTQEVLWASYADNGPLAIGDYDLTHWSDGMLYFPSPDTSYFLCGQMPTAEQPDGYNWFGICDPGMDELFQKQAVELNPEQRAKMFQQIGEMMAEQALLLPLRSDPDVWAVSTRLKDVRFSGVDPFMWIYEWDME